MPCSGGGVGWGALIARSGEGLALLGYPAEENPGIQAPSPSHHRAGTEPKHPGSQHSSVPPPYPFPGFGCSPVWPLIRGGRVRRRRSRSSSWWLKATRGWGWAPRNPPRLARSSASSTAAPRPPHGPTSNALPSARNRSSAGSCQGEGGGGQSGLGEPLMGVPWGHRTGWESRCPGPQGREGPRAGEKWVQPDTRMQTHPQMCTQAYKCPHMHADDCTCACSHRWTYTHMHPPTPALLPVCAQRRRPAAPYGTRPCGCPPTSCQAAAPGATSQPQLGGQDHPQHPPYCPGSP